MVDAGSTLPTTFHFQTMSNVCLEGADRTTFKVMLLVPYVGQQIQNPHPASHPIPKDLNLVKENGKGRIKKDHPSLSPIPPQHFLLPSSDDGDKPENTQSLIGSLNISLHGT